jgi:Icc-related predicted phosphoesterase
MVPVGSTAVRDAIYEYGPMVGLHGHVHESRGTVRLGRTLCINPGSEYGNGVLHGALVLISKGKLRDYQMVVG